jgi:hypothetical protein
LVGGAFLGRRYAAEAVVARGSAIAFVAVR